MYITLTTACPQAFNDLKCLEPEKECLGCLGKMTPKTTTTTLKNQKEALSLSSLSCSWQNVRWSTAANFIGIEEALKKYKQINEYQQWEINSFKCFIRESLCSQIHCQDEDLEGSFQAISNYSALWKHSTPWWEKPVYIWAHHPLAESTEVSTSYGYVCISNGCYCM